MNISTNIPKVIVIIHFPSTVPAMESPIRPRLTVTQTTRLQEAIKANKVPNNDIEQSIWFKERIKLAQIPQHLQDTALIYCCNHYRKFNEHAIVEDKYLKARKRTPRGICLARATHGNMFRKSPSEPLHESSLLIYFTFFYCRFQFHATHNAIRGKYGASDNRVR